MDDMELLRQYAEEGSEPAFAELAKRHVNLVYSTALRHVSRSHAAEEITQAVFVVLARKAKSLRRSIVLSGWLYHAVRLTAANFQRSEIQRIRREQEAYMQSSVNETEDDTWTQIRPLLDTAMAGLSEKDRNAIVLRFFEGRNLRDVGVALGATEEAAKKRVSRAVDKLRKFFMKRGVALSAAVLAGAVMANSVQAAPASLAISAAAAAKSASVASGTLILAKGVLKLMAWTKTKMAILATGIALAVGTSAVIVEKTYSSPPEPAFAGKSLLEWLPDVDYGQPRDKREKAGVAIRQMGTAVIPFLIDDLTPDQKGRRTHYAKPDNRPSDGRLRQATWAFDALGPLGKSAIPKLNSLLEKTAGYVPSALGGIGRDALPSLLQALESTNMFVRDNSAGALATAISYEKFPATEAAAAVPIALRYLADTNAHTRWYAAQLLEALKQQPDRCVPALAEGLTDPESPEVSISCANALRAYGKQSESAIPALIIAADSPNTRLKLAAVRALAAVHSTQSDGVALQKLRGLLIETNAAIRIEAIESLGTMGSAARDAVPDLLALVHGDDNEIVRFVAEQGLGSIVESAETVVPSLCEALKDPSSSVRMEAVNALGKFGPAARSAVPALIETANAHPDLKDNIRVALARINAKKQQ